MNRRTRRRIWTASGVLGATAGAGVAALFLAAQFGAASYATGRYEQAASLGETLSGVPGADAVHSRFLWGTALAAAGDLDAATDVLGSALSRVGADGDDCGLRFNLALVLEARGDADADPAAAAVLFDRAAAVASGAQADCRMRPFGGGPDDASGTEGAPGPAGVKLDELVQRTQGKADAAEADSAEEPEDGGDDSDGGGTAPGDDPPAEQEPSPQDEELARRMDVGLRSHADSLREHNDEVSGSPESPVDRPW